MKCTHCGQPLRVGDECMYPKGSQRAFCTSCDADEQSVYGDDFVVSEIKYDGGHYVRLQNSAKLLV